MSCTASIRVIGKTPRRLRVTSGGANALKASWCEHLLKGTENLGECRWRKTPEMSDETFAVDGAQLIDDDLAAPAGEPAQHTKGIPLSAGRRCVPGHASFQAVCKAGQKAVHLVGHPPGAVVLVSCAERIEILGPAAKDRWWHSEGRYVPIEACSTMRSPSMV